MQVTDEVTWQMRSLGLSRAELASRMGVSAGRVSQVLSGGENITLRTLASLAAAVDARFEVQLRSDKDADYPVDPVIHEVPPATAATAARQEIGRIAPARSGYRPGS
jgi:transcriptional regulator with XRE-family HTH domain